MTSIVSDEQIAAGRKYLFGFGIDDMDDAEIEGIYLAMSAKASETGMVERVARAICVAEGRDPDQVSPFIKVPVGQEPDLRHGRLWKNYETAAAAAIAALNTPDQAVEVLRKAGLDLLGALDAADSVKRGDFYHERKALREASLKGRVVG